MNAAVAQAKRLLQRSKDHVAHLNYTHSLNKRFTCMMMSVIIFLLTLTFIGEFTTTLLGEMFADMHPPMLSLGQLESYYTGVLVVMIILILMVIAGLLGFMIVMIRNIQKTTKDNTRNIRFRGVLTPLQRPAMRIILYVFFFIIMLVLGTATIQTLTCADNVEINAQLRIWENAAKDYPSRVVQTMAASSIFFRGLTLTQALPMSGMIMYNPDNSTTSMNNAAVVTARDAGNIVDPQGQPISTADLNTIMSYGWFTPMQMVSGRYIVDPALWMAAGPTYSQTPDTAYVSWGGGTKLPSEPQVSNRGAGHALVFLIRSLDQPAKQVLTGFNSVVGAMDFNTAAASYAVNTCHAVGVYTTIVSGVTMIIFLIVVMMIAVGYVFKLGPLQRRDKRGAYPGVQPYHDQPDSEPLYAVPADATNSKWQSENNSPDTQYNEEDSDYDEFAMTSTSYSSPTNVA